MTTATKPRRTKTEREIAKHLACAPRVPGRCYKIAEAGVGMDVISSPAIDPGDMSVTATINTPAIDRDDEVILPSGVDVTNYTTNPVVLWEHGWGGIDTPIAKCEDQQGNLALEMSETEIVGTAYFTDRDMTSYQIFSLIDAGIIRATSIHVLPRPNTAQFKNLEDGRRIVVFPDTEMVEWSFGRIGVNPEAVRKICDDRKIAGEKIAESLLKSLSRFAAPRPSSDARLPRGKAMDPGMKPEDEFAEAEGMPEEDKPVDNPEEAPAPEEESDDMGKMKPSERFLSAVGEGIAALKGMVEAGEMEIENPDALTYAADLKEKLAAMESDCETARSGMGGGEKTKKTKKSVSADDAAAMRQFVRKGGANPLRVDGWAARLDRVCRSKSLTDLERAELEEVATGLRRAKSQAKAPEPVAKTVSPEVEGVKSTFGENRQQLEALKGRLASLSS